MAPQEILSEIEQRIVECPDPSVWITRAASEELATRTAELEICRRQGRALPLHGVPFAVKDNIDVRGFPTTAACPAFAHQPERSAPVADRLLNAGALLIGKTNLDQLGAGLAGDRSPYGACRNVFDPKRISGGSSSGSAVAVARGLVSFALGTDTAGSGRVPAGCNNIVGLKPTPRTLDTEGLVPSCPALDGISILALTVDDAWRVFELAGGPPWDQGEALLSDAFATPSDDQLEFFGDTAQAALFRAALTTLEQMGKRRIEIDFRPLREVAAMLYESAFVADRLASIEPFFQKHAADMYPVTRSILEMGKQYSAVDAFKALAVLQKMRPICQRVFAQADMLVVPTMPTIPLLSEVHEDSRVWSRRLGHYTNFVNLLGWAALALPSGFTPANLPGGITLIGPAGSDADLCRFGRAWQKRLGLPLGATGHSLPAEPAHELMRGPVHGWVRVAVAGAHLRGQPLHADLLRMGARFVRTGTTSAKYRFVALMHLEPPRPGLIRDDARKGSIAVEVFDLPYDGFGRLVASVAAPLSIGTVELADGERIKGFLCESFAAASARDITEFGGWVPFMDSQQASSRGRGGP